MDFTVTYSFARKVVFSSVVFKLKSGIRLIRNQKIKTEWVSKILFRALRMTGSLKLLVVDEIPKTDVLIKTS